MKVNSPTYLEHVKLTRLDSYPIAGIGIQCIDPPTTELLESRAQAANLEPAELIVEVLQKGLGISHPSQGAISYRRVPHSEPNSPNIGMINIGTSTRFGKDLIQLLDRRAIDDNTNMVAALAKILREELDEAQQKPEAEIFPFPKKDK